MPRESPANARCSEEMGDPDSCGFARSTAVDCAQDMSDVRFTVPEDAAAILGVTPEAVSETVRFAAAIKLYELGRLSAGAAAALAGVPVPELLARLAEYQVDAFRLSADEIAHDAQSA
jgi:predicted HTH domain antitoxin